MLEQGTLVDRDSLMRRRIDLADLDRKRRIEQMPVGQPFALEENAQRVCVPGEKSSRCSSTEAAIDIGAASTAVVAHTRSTTSERPELGKPDRRRLGRLVLPSVERDERDPQQIGSLLLGRAHRPSKIAYLLWFHARRISTWFPPLAHCGSRRGRVQGDWVAGFRCGAVRAGQKLVRI